MVAFNVMPHSPMKYITFNPEPRMFAVSKSLWHRIEEREKTTHPLIGAKTIAKRAKDFEGAQVRWSRSVAHIGYWLTPTEMPYDELETLSLKAAIYNFKRVAELNYQLGERKSVIDDKYLRRIPARQVLDKIDLEAEGETLFRMLKTMDAFRISYPQAFWHIRWQLRYQWWEEQMLKLHNVKQRFEHENIRTIWYFEHAPVEGWISLAKGLPQTAVVGLRDPGSDAGYYDGEAQPPSFTQWSRQRLHFCEARDFHKMPPEFGKQPIWRVHPLDVEFIGEHNVKN